MKRPLATIGLAVLLTSLAAAGQPAGVLLPLAGLFAVAFVLFGALVFSRAGGDKWRTRSIQAAVVCGAVGFALFYKVGYDEVIVAPARQWAGEDHWVSGHVRTVEDGYVEDTYNAIVAVNAVDGEAVRTFKVWVKAISLVEVGDDIEVELRFGTGSGLAERMLARAVWVPATARSEPWRQAAPDLVDHARRLQYAMGENILTRLPERLSSISAAMTVGDKRFYTAEARDAFRMAGLSHMVAVSGLHMGIVGGGAWALARWLLGRRRRAAAVAGMVAVAGYMLLCGFAASIIRSGVMLLVVMAAGLFRRKADVYTSLGFAALVLCLHSPYAAVDVGLLLSFSATLGALLGGAVERRLRKREPKGLFAKAGVWLRKMSILSLCVSIAIFPVLVWAEMGVALLTVPANLLAVPVLGPIIITGLVLALPAGMPWEILVRPAALINGMLQVWLEKVTGFCADKGLYLTMGGSFVLIVTLVVYGLVALGVKRKRPLHLVTAALALALGVGLHMALSPGTVEVLLAGTGNASVVIVQDKQAVVLYRGAATDSAVERILALRGIEEAALVVDMRQTAQGTQYERFSPAEVAIAADVFAGAVYEPWDNMTLVLRKQGDGFVVLVDIGEERLAVTTGRADITVYDGVSMVSPGAATPLAGEEVVAMLTQAGAPEGWEGPMWYFSSGEGLWIRPGRYGPIREEQDG